jgi:spermidine/putrescine transport system permease protein
MAQATLNIPPRTINASQIRTDLAVRRVGKVILSILPWIGYLFLWLPILILIIFSFNTSRTNAVWQGFTLDWYKALFSGRFGGDARITTENLIKAAQNSLFVGVISMLISTFLGTTVAIGMERFQFRGRRALDLLLYLPVVIPEVTMGLSLLIFFSTSFRTLNGIPAALCGPDIAPGSVCATLGLDTVNFSLSIFTVVIGHVVFCMPFVAIVVRARLQGMSRSLEEAARDLGANEWKTFQRVTLPLLMPGIIAGALLALTLSLDDFVVTLFTAGVGSTTLPLFVQGLIRFGINPSINALSTLIVCVSMGLVLFSLLMQRRRG